MILRNGIWYVEDGRTLDEALADSMKPLMLHLDEVFEVFTTQMTDWARSYIKSQGWETLELSLRDLLDLYQHDPTNDYRIRRKRFRTRLRKKRMRS